MIGCPLTCDNIAAGYLLILFIWSCCCCCRCCCCCCCFRCFLCPSTVIRNRFGASAHVMCGCVNGHSIRCNLRRAQRCHQAATPFHCNQDNFTDFVPPSPSTPYPPPPQPLHDDHFPGHHPIGRIRNNNPSDALLRPDDFHRPSSMELCRVVHLIGWHLFPLSINKKKVPFVMMQRSFETFRRWKKIQVQRPPLPPPPRVDWTEYFVSELTRLKSDMP